MCDGKPNLRIHAGCDNNVPRDQNMCMMENGSASSHRKIVGFDPQREHEILIPYAINTAPAAVCHH